MNVRNGLPPGYPPQPSYDPYARQNSPFPGINDPGPGPFGFGGGFQSGGVPGGPAPSHKTSGAAAENLLEGAAKSSLPVVSNAAELAEIVDPGGGKPAKKDKEKGGLLGGFSLDKIGELKGVVDRLGGIDGILNSVGKMQKVVANLQQMAPLIKVLAGSFKKESKSSQKSYDDDDDVIVRPKRRKRRKPGGKGRKPAAPGAAMKGSGPRPRPNAKKTR
ncbi:hypothetical protein PCCS19_50190 [Paenibacillus sp. CCS19]|uniref:hypothetical protein n=1 Tax=Paenibacillus sp. CCS19 TaxID=3158387 RepID=UPI0025658262|nr:hypothetical protein [Paenibacillus cellulosilyticus]GMK41960.1 hypothetical protein PCCS19_50190 [Paenibacillus cellulosilyticus]